MGKYGKIHHFTIVPMEKCELFSKDNLISEIIGARSGHEEDFLLLKHASILPKISFFRKFFTPSP
jgi:hypothetical protein